MNAQISMTDHHPPHAGQSAILHSNCRGVTPLTARLESWMLDTSIHHSQALREALALYGSPLNLISTAPFRRNVEELSSVARKHELPFRVFFARKANKCFSFVKTALEMGIGVDVASEEECRQSLECGYSGDDLICTAAVKSSALIRLCIKERVTIAIDNWDEFHNVIREARDLRRTAVVAIRLSGFKHQRMKLDSRFGFDVDEIDAVLEALSKWNADGALAVNGLHFHLDGYCARQRISAIQCCLPIIDRMQAAGQLVRFLDIGGGLPMCYLEEERQWLEFWAWHRAALLDQREPLTFRNHGLGLMAVDGHIHGDPNVYPYYQSVTRGQWLENVLSAPSGDGGSLAESMQARSLELRCEPGRSVLDGCGMTVAHVEFCKRNRQGHWYVGLSMNRTQCRSGSDDFLVDPIVIRQSDANAGAPPMEGFLVGAYCTESELVLLRKLHFPHGIAAGDLVVFPNTAGYLMHFLESRSHQFPLAKNVIVDSVQAAGWHLDPVDSGA